MYPGDKSLKGNVAVILDECGTDVDELSLAVAVNSFLEIAVAADEALAVYAALLDMTAVNMTHIDIPLRNSLLSDVRDLPPSVVAKKMCAYSLSIRKLFADSLASSLCRQYGTLLEQIRNAVQSNSSDRLLAIADSAILLIPDAEI